MRALGEVLAPWERETPNEPGADQDGILTDHGWFSWEELHEVDAKFEQDRNGDRIIRFPVAYETLGNLTRRPIYREVPEWVRREDR